MDSKENPQSGPMQEGGGVQLLLLVLPTRCGLSSQDSLRSFN
jgi:hypothetical protein